MLNDATGFSKVYLAVGYTDLRLGISGLSMLVSQNFQLDPYEKMSCFSSVEEKQTVSKDWYSRETVICFFIKNWSQENFNGLVPKKK